MFTDLGDSGKRDLMLHTDNALILLPMIVTRTKQTKFLFKYLISVEETRGFPSNSNSRQLWLKCLFSMCSEVELGFHFLTEALANQASEKCFCMISACRL